MKNFKVGDKVRRVTDSYWPEDFGYKGEVYTVKEEQNGGIVIINNFSCCSSNFELAEEEEEKPTETNFKVGDRVKRVVFSNWPERYGELGSVYTVLSVNFEGNIAVINKDNHANRYYYELVTEEKPTETKFKVGDRIKRIKTAGFPCFHGTLGEVYTVLEMRGNHPVVIPGKSSAASYMFELVTEEEEKPVYEVGEVYLWKGGECPLPEGTEVSVRCGTKDMSTISPAWASTSTQNAYWEHRFINLNIVMFKVVSYPEPAPVKRSVTLELTEDQIKAIESVLLKEGRL